MASLIFTCFCSSKANTTAKIRDSSTWCPQPGQHISIQTYRELNPAPTSSPTSTRMEIHSNGESSRSMGDLQEEGNRQPMTLTPQRLTQEVRQRLLGLYGN
ncbi:C4 [Tomato leaf curl Nigeria virus]|uniref:C4 n=1 Tax=Tomato leaf curl Nigeria virus TaxID=1513530 RepID=C0L9G5_9GEMI|nr:C4 protein [Tomato leaf curl Nigeria virus-[Nigeria:2006]]ACN43236.1 C4 [Tomato leaf curl Nigeria virus-[Nigeria:2006]]